MYQLGIIKFIVMCPCLYKMIYIMANPDVVANTRGERPDHKNETVVSH